MICMPLTLSKRDADDSSAGTGHCHCLRCIQAAQQAHAHHMTPSPVARPPNSVHVALQVVGPAAIPQFHFPQGRPLSADQHRSIQSKLDRLYSSHPEGLSVPAFKALMTEVCLLRR